MHTVTIDTVEGAGITELAQLKARCFPREETTDEVVLRRRAKAFPESFLVMKEDGVVTGMVNGCVGNQRMICDAVYEDESLHDPYNAYQTVFGLDVHPVYQHQGYAGGPMQALIETAKKRRRKGVVLTCKKHLVDFYEQFGYHDMRVGTSVYGGTGRYDILLYFA